MTHGIVKERIVPDQEIEFAMKCLEQARNDIEKYTLVFRG